jgi:hypothetical protein
MPAGAVLGSEAQLQPLLASAPLRKFSGDSGTRSASQEGADFADDGIEAALADAPDGRFTFDDIRLRAGDRIQLQPPARVSVERHVVRLIGFLENATLLVTAPTVNGLRLQLRENDKLVARVFSSQKAFGFSSSVQKVCKIPYDYLHLSFPDRIQGSVIRNSPRVRTRIITSIAAPDAGDEGARQPGVIVNLSADGALVKVRQRLFDKGQTIQLSFRVNLHKVGAYLTVNAAIRGTFDSEEKDGDGAPMFNYGLQFQDLAANDSVILQSLIYQQMIEQPQSLT